MVVGPIAGDRVEHPALVAALALAVAAAAAHADVADQAGARELRVALETGQLAGDVAVAAKNWPFRSREMSFSSLSTFFAIWAGWDRDEGLVEGRGSDRRRPGSGSRVLEIPVRVDLRVDQGGLGEGG